MPRRDFIKTIQASRSIGNVEFARHVAADWLAAWPGDLEIQHLLAELETEQGAFGAAEERLTKILAQDPEGVKSYRLLASILRTTSETDRATFYAMCAGILTAVEPVNGSAPSWAQSLYRGWRAFTRAKYPAALEHGQEALAADPDLALPTLLLMRTHLATGDKSGAIVIARIGHQRWPDCIAFRLMIADDLLSRGHDKLGLKELHQTASQDLNGRLAKGILSNDHPYRALWPTHLAAQLTRSIPEELRKALGSRVKYLPEPSEWVPEVSTDEISADVGHDPPDRADEISSKAKVRESSEKAKPEKSHPLPMPESWEAFKGPNEELPDDLSQETLVEIEDEYKSEISRTHSSRRWTGGEGRKPAYIALCSRTRLSQLYSVESVEEISDQIRSLTDAIGRNAVWSAYPIYIDDPSSLVPFGLSPADPSNAWQIKLRLADLDRALGERGEMIGTVLIVGGEDIIPFHQLPNPTDDDDDTVPSDNPYATSDENYFAPEWPVGRLPSEKEPDSLLQQLRSVTAEHEANQLPTNPLLILRAWFQRLLERLIGRNPRTLGYSASIWRKASMVVFKTIGEPKALITSPPIMADRLPTIAVQPTQFSYFNLHGLEDSPEWFGQRDPLRDESADLDFPVALRPEDVVNGGRSPQIVFTEACYGANILGKTSETALCLKFLTSGSQAVIGSTKISYGSVTPPLIAADLLGRLFWQQINLKLPVGEALRRAKLSLASEMHRRQGFLDGEDQKTLISFVLYGDPLFLPGFHSDKASMKRVRQPGEQSPQMKTVCALSGPPLNEETIDPAMIGKVKLIVSQYLPGMADAVCQIRSQHAICSGDDHTCPTHQLGVKTHGSPNANSMVVTFSKQIPDGTRNHPHYARLTLDESGRVVKLAVSR